METIVVETTPNEEVRREKVRLFIKKHANAGVQLRNSTIKGRLVGYSADCAYYIIALDQRTTSVGWKYPNLDGDIFLIPYSKKNNKKFWYVYKRDFRFI